MARPRKASDDAILDAAELAMAQRGPLRYTIEDVAKQVGVTPQAILLRFGTKRALQLAVAARRGRRTAAARPGARPVETLLDSVRDSLPVVAATPEELANSMAFYLSELNDPALREPIVAQVADVRRNLLAFMGAAVRAGELRGASPAKLARIFETTYNGALYSWVIDRRGDAWSYVGRRLREALEPYSRI